MLKYMSMWEIEMRWHLLKDLVCPAAPFTPAGKHPAALQLGRDRVTRPDRGDPVQGRCLHNR
jgi:hypothetical protein